ncbi:acyltransferase family protein [Motilimonas sp. E26]|uniref:acyltransferase n=1 Tax=Motilimonas sp. E26 TaxID=2865674 RepID=UPI001E43B411|nr:acyltransferase family protein [Motilimonas sp. E26]MCE0558946.1 acyltransferase family protein [Motilimonas sp. E26]
MTFTSVRPSIFYLDLLRCCAAFAVVAIHVLGPWRYLYGQIPDFEWLAAAGINSLTRWAVPVFMLISGALLLSDKREFDCSYYLHRRLAKVAIPFVIWSLIYAFAGGFSNGGWQQDKTMDLVEAATNTPVWYHLWFFYDFIPLYFVIPLLIPLLRVINPERFKLLLAAWLLLTLIHWLNVESFLRENLLLYSGYLLLGWYLFNRDNSAELPLWLAAGLGMLTFNFFGTWYLSHQHGEYHIFFMGYKSLNTVIIAGMLFVLAQTYGERITGRWRQWVSLVSKYSLGIYLIHPLFLIPVREISNGYYDFFASNWLAIPALTICVLAISLLATMTLAKLPILKRLVP